MKSKIKNFLMNPWTVSIGAGLIVLFVTIAIDLITAVAILSTLKKVITTIWTGILAFLNYKLKVWWVLIGVAVVVFGLYLYVKYIEYEQKLKENNKPPFLEYTQDFILGYNWKWVWVKNIYGEYGAENLQPVCSHCKTPLVDNWGVYGKGYKCLRCNKIYSSSIPDFDHVKIMIHDNTKRKYFSNE